MRLGPSAVKRGSGPLEEDDDCTRENADSAAEVTDTDEVHGVSLMSGPHDSENQWEFRGCDRGLHTEAVEKGGSKEPPRQTSSSNCVQVFQLNKSKEEIFRFPRASSPLDGNFYMKKYGARLHKVNRCGASPLDVDDPLEEEEEENDDDNEGVNPLASPLSFPRRVHAVHTNSKQETERDFKADTPQTVMVLQNPQVARRDYTSAGLSVPCVKVQVNVKTYVQVLCNADGRDSIHQTTDVGSLYCNWKSPTADSAVSPL
ncbi:hypothetical protein LSM04_004829 [Trypanosoma melophagium]|uniref:uncharacterized protein n=1 Tax=Trypanosoma melophagium TaxID=715481 RepID=UPI00351A0397|nr:hypothetical protein LSM04_004829 [Trypanosoma melophagium]